MCKGIQPKNHISYVNVNIANIINNQLNENINIDDNVDIYDEGKQFYSKLLDMLLVILIYVYLYTSIYSVIFSIINIIYSFHQNDYSMLCVIYKSFNSCAFLFLRFTLPMIDKYVIVIDNYILKCFTSNTSHITGHALYWLLIVIMYIFVCILVVN
jgi:hypothetical protein